jgi:hypothetical protein
MSHPRVYGDKVAGLLKATSRAPHVNLPTDASSTTRPQHSRGRHGPTCKRTASLQELSDAYDTTDRPEHAGVASYRRDIILDRIT